jgi:polysaccharide chain length determinant protein (PEP-CTERM system associated)
VPGSQELSSFNVSFSAGDPYTAQKVTSELTNLFINENLEIQDVESKETTQFFESQLEDARKNLGDQEEKIRQFKAQHVSDLPGQLQSNLAILGGLQSQMQGEQDGLNRAKQQNTYYQSLLSQYRSFQRPAKTSTGSTSMGLTALDQELEKLQAQLADLMSRGYTDRHPDVRKLKDQIAETQQMKQQALAEVKKPDVSASSDAQDAVDPRDATAMAELKSQLQANQLEITNHEQSIAALNARIADYQARLGQEPVREQQLADLSRGYDQSKANYDDLLKKKNASELSTNLTERQQGEHFRVLDPPSLPVKPDFPDHLKLCAVGFAGGLALGLALVVVVEFMDDRLHSEKDLKALVPVSVIVEIPSIASPKELRRQQNSLKLAWVAATLVFAIILAGAAISYLRG